MVLPSAWSWTLTPSLCARCTAAVRDVPRADRQLHGAAAGARAQATPGGAGDGGRDAPPPAGQHRLAHLHGEGGPSQRARRPHGVSWRSPVLLSLNVDVFKRLVRCATSLPACCVFPHLKSPPLSAAGPRKMVETGRSSFGYETPHTVGTPLQQRMSWPEFLLNASRAQPQPRAESYARDPEARDYVGYPTGSGHRA
jgi:hypothetical protein